MINSNQVTTPHGEQIQTGAGKDNSGAGMLKDALNAVKDTRIAERFDETRRGNDLKASGSQTPSAQSGKTVLTAENIAEALQAGTPAAMQPRAMAQVAANPVQAQQRAPAQAAPRMAAGQLNAATPPTQRANAKSTKQFYQEPVVGWLVIVGGPGLGAYRPVFDGNNTIGRAPSQHITIDFGDQAISAEEQAYIRYDGDEKRFLFIPNLAKTNVVSVNDEKPSGAIQLSSMDVISMGRTKLVFVPFCGEEFDWSDL